MNKEQFLSAVSAWLSQASRDVQSKVNEFVRTSGMHMEEVADALDLSVDELSSIANGQAALTLEHFAKLLIATGHVIEIKPINAVPNGAMGRMPRGAMMPPSAPVPPQPRTANGQFARRPVGAPVPPPMGYPMPPMPEMEAPQNDETRNFDELSRNELVRLIRQNGWANEINIPATSRGELIDFLEGKFNGVPANAQQPIESTDEKRTRLMGMLDDAVKAHPELLETISKYLDN